MKPLLILTLSSFMCLAGFGQEKKRSKKAGAEKASDQSSGSRLLSGTLVDANCRTPEGAAGKAKTLDQTCAITGATKTFGLLLTDGKFVKFDEGGNAKAMEALKTNKKGQKAISGQGRRGEKFNAKVGGALTGDTLNVESVRL